VTEAFFIRYLAAKRTVDDRALNRRVWDAMITTAGQGSPKVLEIGGGIGTMIERVVDEGRLAPRTWTLLDAQPSLIAEAKRRLAGKVPFPVELVASGLDGYIEMAPGPVDLVVANAVLDLFDPPRILPRMARLCRRGGLFLFSITFDGLTALEPEIDPALDQKIMALYHQTMDQRVIDGRPSGDSRCGRHLLTLLPRCGYTIIEAGSSDWIVHPRDGGYPADEEFFLSCILAFFEESLAARPELAHGELAGWLSRRREQLHQRRLVFMAHQIDVLAAGPGG
jgi:SAM-dependent methyltransferase